MSSNNEGKKVVCVTCASSYIASWLVKLLLLRGYTVKAIVCDPNDPTKVEHLVKLDGAKERLDLVKADMMEDGSFDSVVEGCEGVFHTAPASFSFNHVLNDPQKDLIEPAVKGTLNVLKSCAKSASVKRVVLTSSISAVLYNGKPRSPQVVVDETWFSDPDFLRNTQKWYLLCKSLIEEEAWKFARENNIDMVALNPGMVIGPLLQPSLNDSASTVLKLLKGEIYPNFIMGWGHAKDVANAHIQAFEIPSANGRYCLIERITNYSDVAKLLNHLYPMLQLPEKRDVDDESVVPKYQVSKDKAKTLGIEFIPLEVSLKEMIESLKDNKFVNF